MTEGNPLNKLDKLLRRLKPAQILAVTAAVWVAALAASFLVLGPLAFLLLGFAGEAVASIGSVLVTIGGMVAATYYLPKPFLKAYYGRRFDDELQRVLLAFQEARRNG